MRPFRLIMTPLAKLVGLALGIAVATAVQGIGGRGLLPSFLFGEQPWATFFLIVAATVSSTFAIVSAFTATLSMEPRRLTATVAFSILTLNAGIYFGHHAFPWPELLYFMAVSFGWTVFSMAATFTLVSLLNVTSRVAWTTATGVTALYLFLNCVGFFMRSWIGLSTLSDVVPTLRDASMSLGLVTLAAAVAFHRPYQLNTRSPLDSLMLRFPSTKDSPLARNALLVSLGGMGLNLAFIPLSRTLDLPILTLMATVPWSCLGFFILSFGELGLLSSEHRAGNLSARLTPRAAQRLLRRHESGHENWAAAMGVKTANFVVDHDPHGFLHQHLPATILQIRTEEIHRSISGLLKETELVNRTHGTRMVGAIDSEHSLRPCIDTLLMYACLYMDIGPLVERRIKGLATLFPIIDPTLTSIITADDLNQLMRRLEWFFYLDFAWTDQHLITSGATTRFDVTLSSMGMRDRANLIQAIEKAGSLGAQVWLSPDARERLIQEAPQLRPIISLSTVQQSAAKEENVLFSMRFEHLIPMLQRYFELDQRRRMLLDFEPTQNHSRMLSLLNLQLSRASSTGEITEILSSITTVPWSGYKEKDSALKLILLAHARLKEKISPDKPLHLSESREAKTIYELILRTVQKIGYPSQMLHHAQMAKLALRDVTPLLKAAASPAHPRFVEAWLLLSTVDYRRMRPEQRKEISTLIHSLGASGKLSRLSLVQAKAVDAWSNLCRSGEESEIPLYHEGLEALWTWFVRARVDLDIMNLLIDAQLYATSVHGDQFKISAETMRQAEVHIAREIAKLDPNNPLALAINGRLQSLRAKHVSAA